MRSLKVKADSAKSFVAFADSTKNKKLFANATFLLGPCRRPYPLPSETFCPWVIVSHGYAGRITYGYLVDRFAPVVQHVSHCESCFLRNSQTLTRKSNELCVFGLWVMWVIVPAVLNRAKYRTLHQPYNLQSNLWFQENITHINTQA
jgi:hypothetical protein